jgi:hypothetical protein
MLAVDALDREMARAEKLRPSFGAIPERSDTEGDCAGSERYVAVLIND